MRKFTEQERKKLHENLDRKINYYGKMFEKAEAKRAALKAISPKDREQRRKEAWEKFEKDGNREDLRKVLNALQ